MSTYDLFSFTEIISKDFMELAQKIEATLISQPQAALMQTRLYNEQLVKLISKNEGLEDIYPLKHVERVHKLYRQNAIEEEIYLKMEWIRKKGNKAAHDVKEVSQQDAFQAHRFIYEISVWYIQIYINYDFEAPIYKLPLEDKTVEVKQDQIDSVVKPMVDEALKKIDSMWVEVNRELEELKKEKERIRLLDGENRTEQNKEENKQHIHPEEFPLLEFLEEHNLEFIDKRDRKGALWIIGDWSISEVLFTLKENNIYFRFSKKGSKSTGYKPAWFLLNKTLKGTKIESSKKVSAEKENSISEAEESITISTEKVEETKVLTLEPISLEFWLQKSQLSIPKHLLPQSLESGMHEGALLLRERYGVKQFVDLNVDVLRKVYQLSQSDFHKIVNDLYMMGIRFSGNLKQFEPYKYGGAEEVIYVSKDAHEIPLSQKLPLHLETKLKNRHMFRMKDLEGMLISTLWAILKEDLDAVIKYFNEDGTNVVAEDNSLSINVEDPKLISVQFQDNNVEFEQDKVIQEMSISGCDHFIRELNRVGVHKLSDFQKPLDGIHEELIGVGPKVVKKFWEQLIQDKDPDKSVTERILFNENGERLLYWKDATIAVFHEVNEYQLTTEDFPGCEKAIRTMREEGIKVIADLPSDFLELTKLKGVGAGKVNTIFNNLSFLLPLFKDRVLIEQLSPEERYDHEVKQSKEWINAILNSEEAAKKIKIQDRYLDLMNKRYQASLNGQHLTLEALGEQIGVTRERVRQILAKGDNRIAEHLSQFIDLVKLKIKEHNDLLINTWFSSDSFGDYLIKTAFEQQDIHARRFGNVEVLTTRTKPEMETFVLDIEKDVEEYFDLHVITHAELKNFSEERAEEDGTSNIIVSHIANEMINWLSEEQGVLKKITKIKVAEMVMLQYPEGVEIYKREDELNDKANVLMPGSFEKERSFTSVIQRDEIKERIMLWGRGVFIHKRFVTIDDRWIREVKKYVEEVVEEEDFIHVLKLYNEFKDEALKRNIPNEYALYTLLRINNDASLNLDRFPLILRGGESRLGNAQYIKEFIKSQNRPVTKEELRNHFVDKLGWKGFTLEFTLSSASDIIASNHREYALLSFYEHIKTDDLEIIITHIKNKLKDSPFVHIKAVFEEYKLILGTKDISSRYELYNILKQFDIEGMDFRRYPYVFTPTYEFDSFSARKLVETYIKEEQDLVPREDMEQWSVEIFGEEDRILDAALAQSDNILYYSRGRYGEYIHKDYVLTEEYGEATVLEQVKDSYNHIRSESGKEYVLLSDIFDMIEPSLPVILETIPWSKELLGDVVKRSKEWSLLGSYYEIIIGVDSSLTSNTDFIEYVLNEKYNGAAKLKDLKEYLISIKYSAHGQFLSDVEEVLDTGKAPFIVQDDEIIHMNLIEGAEL